MANAGLTVNADPKLVKAKGVIVALTRHVKDAPKETAGLMNAVPKGIVAQKAIVVRKVNVVPMASAGLRVIVGPTTVVRKENGIADLMPAVARMARDVPIALNFHLSLQLWMPTTMAGYRLKNWSRQVAI